LPCCFPVPVGLARPRSLLGFVFFAGPILPTISQIKFATYPRRIVWVVQRDSALEIAYTFHAHGETYGGTAKLKPAKTEGLVRFREGQSVLVRFDPLTLRNRARFRYRAADAANGSIASPHFTRSSGSRVRRSATRFCGSRQSSNPAAADIRMLAFQQLRV
jgi:hypothetical protein